jgi:hypothetical protein
MENSPRNKFAHLRMINEALCSALPLLLHRRSNWVCFAHPTQPAFPAQNGTFPSHTPSRQ